MCGPGYVWESEERVRGMAICQSRSSNVRFDSNSNYLNKYSSTTLASVVWVGVSFYAATEVSAIYKNTKLIQTFVNKQLINYYKLKPNQ